jgi:hypothetical protein
MSPRALARAISVAMPVTSADEASTAGHAPRDHVNAWPDTAKNASQASVATDWVQATMTIGGIAWARPFTTANWAAWVRAAPSERTNQLRRARSDEPRQSRLTTGRRLATSAACIAATSADDGGSTGGRASALRKIPRKTRPSFMRAWASPDGSPAP